MDNQYNAGTYQNGAYIPPADALGRPGYTGSGRRSRQADVDAAWARIQERNKREQARRDKEYNDYQAYLKIQQDKAQKYNEDLASYWAYQNAVKAERQTKAAYIGGGIGGLAMGIAAGVLAHKLTGKSEKLKKSPNKRLAITIGAGVLAGLAGGALGASAGYKWAD